MIIILSNLIGQQNIKKYLNTYHEIKRISHQLKIKYEGDIDDNEIGKYLYNKNIFKFIGNGAFRAVFDIDDKYVLKIALHKDGEEHNYEEYNRFYHIQQINKKLIKHLAKPYYISKGHRCLIMQKIKYNCNLNEQIDDDISNYIAQIYQETKYEFLDIHDDNLKISQQINSNQIIKDNWKIIDYAL